MFNLKYIDMIMNFTSFKLFFINLLIANSCQRILNIWLFYGKSGKICGNHFPFDYCVAHGLFFSKLYYSSCEWLTDMLSKLLIKRITSSSNACLQAVFGYCRLSTPDLHNQAGILTPFQKAYYDKAVMFRRIVNNCEHSWTCFCRISQQATKDIPPSAI